MRGRFRPKHPESEEEQTPDRASSEDEAVSESQDRAASSVPVTHFTVDPADLIDQPPPPVGPPPIAAAEAPGGVEGLVAPENPQAPEPLDPGPVPVEAASEPPTEAVPTPVAESPSVLADSSAQIAESPAQIAESPAQIDGPAAPDDVIILGATGSEAGDVDVASEADSPPSTQVPVADSPPGTPRHAAKDESAGLEDPIRFAGVYYLAVDTDGPTAVPGLTLELDEHGVILTKPDGEAAWAAEWSEVAELATPERTRLPDGTRAVVVVITLQSGRDHRYVVPSRRPAATEAQLRKLARRHQVTPDRPARRQPAWLVAAVLVVVVGAVTVLLLAAGHVIKL